MTEPKCITVGRILHAFGIRGWVELVSYTEPEANLFNHPAWHLVNEQNPRIPARDVIVQAHRPHKQKTSQHTWVAQLSGCEDRDQALLLRGMLIQIPRTALPPLAENQYYWTDLEGLAVYDENNVFLGTIDYLFETGANDVIVVKNQEKVIFIPYVYGEVIKTVDLIQKKMTVVWASEDK